MGNTGLHLASKLAVLHANYLRVRLSDAFTIPFPGICMHEFVLSAEKQAVKGVTALVLAKNLIDAGMHPPTIYFPLIVKEAMMVEPTETESLETLDRFAEEMLRLSAMANTDAEYLMHAPYNMPVNRLDEVGAARKPVLCQCMAMEDGV
jgi:glycine dehydrogenase subunit 2